MKQKLTERYIINLMREEWTQKVNSILEKSVVEKTQKPMDDLRVHIDVDKDGSKETVVSPDLSVKRKSPQDYKKDSKEYKFKSDPMAGLVYNIESINDQDNTITLSRTDVDGVKKITITQQEFEANYKRK